MPTALVFNRYTSDTGYEYVVCLGQPTLGQWEIDTIIRFKIGRTSGEEVGPSMLPWSVRQILNDNYQIAL